MLQEDDILGMLKTVLHIAQDERSSLTLRSVAETTLVDITRILFERAGDMAQRQGEEARSPFAPQCMLTAVVGVQVPAGRYGADVLCAVLMSTVESCAL